MAEIHGIPVHRGLGGMDRTVDMVAVFRPKEDLYDSAEQVTEIGAKGLWG